ncbi:MAG: signal peptidase I [Thermoanaerobaculia bacterium]
MKRLLTFVSFGFVILVFALRTFVVGLSVIPQNGMYPNFPAGSRVLTLKHPYRAAGQVRRGDVVAYLQDIGGVQYKFIWRVVGLPGERVETKNGQLIVDGSQAGYRPLATGENSSMFAESTKGISYSVAFLPARMPIADVSYRVPPNSFFVLGDNRHNAADIRVYGLVPFSAIVGKAVFSW